MALDAWLPIGFKLPDGAKVRVALFEGADWQVYETQGGGRALVVHNDLAARWQDAGLIDEGTFDAFQFGDRPLRAISCAPSQTLLPVSEAKSPDNKAEALSFALALKATRDIDPESALQDALSPHLNVELKRGDRSESMAKYSPEFQEHTVRQLMPPMLRSVAQVSRESGVSEPTLYAWKKRYQEQGAIVPAKATQPQGWDARSKLAALIQTAAMNEVERSAWCREHGLYAEQLDAWKAAFEGMDETPAVTRSELTQARKDKRDLQKELQRKEKALAETAALLALSKKARAIWGDEDA